MPEFVAIVGAPGSGKHRLASQLKKSLGRNATVLSLADFAGEGSDPEVHEPGAVDWSSLDVVLGALRENQPTEAPALDRKTGERSAVIVKPAPVIIIEGCWLLHLEVLRKLFALAVFIHCPADVCFQRLVEREEKAGKRTPDEVEEFYRDIVEPVVQRYIMPQASHADRIITAPPTAMDVDAVVEDCRKLLAAAK